MSRLSDLVQGAVNDALATGEIITHDLAVSLRDGLDHQTRDQLVVEALTRRITQAAKAGRKALTAAANENIAELPFKIAGAYPVDVNQGRIKRTLDLTEFEVRRIIQIRKDQINADTAALVGLTTAYQAARPHWVRNPDWLFGQALSAAAAEQLSRQSS